MSDVQWMGMVPATDWAALFVDPHTREVYVKPVVAWVWTRTVEPDGSVYDGAEGLMVEGRAVMEAEYHDDADYFVCYCHRSEKPDMDDAAIDRVIKDVERMRKVREERRGRGAI